MNNEKYLNFPIQLLTGFITDTRKTLDNIVNYSVYENALKLEHGTELQKIKDSAGFYQMKLGSVKHSLDNGKLLYNSLPNNSPKVGMNLSIWWDFYKNEKTEFEKVCLLGFLAIKSILGNKSYCKVTNLYLWARMDGKTNTIDNVSELSNEIRKYANRYQTENIKSELILNWHLIYYSRYTRGFYVSLKMSLEDLIFEAEKKRKSTKDKQQKQLQNEALKKALDRLKLKPP